MTRLITKSALAIAAFGLAGTASAADLPMAHSNAPAWAAAHEVAPQVANHGKDKRWKRGRGHARHGDYGYRDDYREYRRGDRYAYDGEPVYRNTRVWRGRDNRYYCRKEDGTTGLLIGGAVGGLIGNEIAGYGEKTLGTILGAVGGALLGREIDRSDARCR